MCEQSSCKCTPSKDDYTSLDYQLSILTAAKEGKEIECRANSHLCGWLLANKSIPFNFKTNHYRIKREPRKAVIWSHPNQPGTFLEHAKCPDQRKREWTSRGWSPSTYIEVLDACSKEICP